MAYPAPALGQQSPLNYQVIPPSSAGTLVVKSGKGQLWAIVNASAIGQVNAVKIYDASSIGDITTNSRSVLYQPTLSAAQIIPMLIQGLPWKFDFGIVAVPAGPANPDGGWTFLYL